MPETPDMLKHALAYAAAGWRVFPLKPKGKEPLGRLVPRGCLDATTNEQKIRDWWDVVPSANIGLATGEGSGIVVLDIDDLETFSQAFPDANKSPLRTAVARTSKGWHYVFRHPGGHVGNMSRQAQGFDVRGDGGYIVAPPSIHPSGATYRWHTPPKEAQPAPLPDWLPLAAPSGDGQAGKAPRGPSPSGRSQETPGHDADRACGGCAWLEHCRDDRVSEPEWYAMMSIVGRCENGLETVHDWSEGHPEYNAADTDEKLEHALEASGPRTCRSIAEHLGAWNDYCSHCEHWGEIKSPIVLARKPLPEPEAEERPPHPAEETGRKERSGNSFIDVDAFQQKREARVIGELYHEMDEHFRLMAAGELDLFEPTGFPLLDSKIEGYAKGHMNLFAALSGGGKTSWMLQSLLACGKRAQKQGREGAVLFFSAEMLAKELYERMACMLAEVNLRKLRKRTASAKEWERVAEAVATVRSLPIVVDDTPRPDLEHMYQRLREVQERHGAVLMWGFDYIEKSGAVAPTEELRVSAAAQGMSELAKMFPDAPNITLSQLNRKILSRSNTRPGSGDLRYSQKPYDEAYIVLLLDSPIALQKHGAIESGQEVGDGVELVVSKHRSGMDGFTHPMRFHREITLFSEYGGPSEQQDYADRDRAFIPPPGTDAPF